LSAALRTTIVASSVNEAAPCRIRQLSSRPAGVNLWGVIHGIRTFVRTMLKQNRPAHIVNTASIAGLMRVCEGRRDVRPRNEPADQLCVAPASQHFFDFRNVQLLASNLRASKFLQRNALRLSQLEQSLILIDSAALVKQQFCRMSSTDS
jgi:NAD(P)-dependent dehydrogenase (short-subunit alcohol dehydrogenase family)